MADRRQIDLNTLKLRVFREVVDRESLTAAARSLVVSQPVVSAHIRSLEQLLGSRLLERKGRRMVPTETGLIVYEYARATLDATQRLADQIAYHRSAMRGQLRLGADATAGSYSLPRLMFGFLQGRDEVEMALHVADHKTIQTFTLNGVLDFGYVTRMDYEPGLVFEPLGEEATVLVAAPDHPWSRRGSVRLAELSEQTYVSTAPGTARREWEDQWFAQRGIQRRVRLAFGHAEGAKQAVQAGFGVSLLFRSGVARELADGSLVAIALEDEPWPSTPRGMVYRKGARLSQLQQAFLDHCRASAAHVFES